MAGAPTSILVRVQAKGGKFLADDIGGAEVVIRDAQTGRWLGGGLATGTSSGDLKSAYTPTCSLSTIVTPSKLGVQWLEAGSNTAGLSVSLEIDRPTLLEITAFGPMGGLQSAHRVTTTQWIVPGQTIDQGPGFIVELPGLLVQVLDPPTHGAHEIRGVATEVALVANVTMMCGCPISTSGPWLESDFQVAAAISPPGKPTTTVFLDYSGKTSRFLRLYQATTLGVYQAVITAVQKSTGNTGTGTVTFTVVPGS